MRSLGYRLLLIGVLTGVGLGAQARERAGEPFVAVGAQYDTSHVYVAPQDVNRFIASFLATFGGASTKQFTVTVTPTPSLTTSQLLQTPVGTVSLFGFKTPVPYPFGAERTGYLVTDLDLAIRAARLAGAAVVVAPFPDPIGRDAVIQWPGGVDMQLYWHFKKPHYARFETVPENRVYLSAAARTLSSTAFWRSPMVTSSPMIDTRRVSRSDFRTGLSLHPGGFPLRQAHGARDRRPLAVSLRPRDDRLCGSGSRGDPCQGSGCGRQGPGPAIYGRRPHGCHGRVSGRLCR